ncbi:MAG: hypothetical protein ACYTGX_02730 [Planctomycetota bacterium]|jgi:hypothetical protein
MRGRGAVAVPALVAVVCAAAALASPARAQDGDQRERRQPLPRFVLNPRPRAGWVPVVVDVENGATERARLRAELSSPGNENSLVFRTTLDVEAGDRRRMVGYLWGVADDTRWGRRTEPCRSARLFVSDGTSSRTANLSNQTGAGEQEDGWQIAVIGTRTLTWRNADGERTAVGEVPLVPNGVRPGNPDPSAGWRGRQAAPPPGSPQAKAKLNAFLKQYPVRLTARRLDLDALPGHLIGWDPADAVLFTAGSHLDDMAPSARGALVQWVALGGVVIVCPGDTAAALSHPLVQELCGPLQAAQQAGPRPEGAEGPVAVALGSATDTWWPARPADAEVLEAWAGAAMLSGRRLGRGWVYYCALDLTRASTNKAAQPRGSPAAAVAACLQHARARQRGVPRALGHRIPGLPAGEMPADELSWVQFNERSRWSTTLVEQNWFNADRTAMREMVSGIHTGRDRMPSAWSVTAFLLLYLAALGPGVWWLRRRRGGGLIGIPLTLGAALLFSIGAVVFGLATRGVGLVTQRVTLLWPVPGRPIAGEQTALSLFAGIARRVDVTFPGQVAPLPLSADGTVGGGSTLTVELEATAAHARDVGIGSWSTRVLLAEGARSIGGVIEATAPAGAFAVPATPGAVVPGTTISIRNGSTMRLEAGALWIVRRNRNIWVEVPAIPPGGSAVVAVPVQRRNQPWVEERLGWTPPATWRRRGALGLIVGAPNGQHDRLGVNHLTPLRGRPVYVAPVRPENVPGGGPECPGSRVRDDVLCVVPVEPAR